MSNSKLNTVDLTRLSEVNEAVALAKIERAEHVAELLNAAGSWVKRVIVSAFSSLTHSAGSASTRHAH